MAQEAYILRKKLWDTHVHFLLNKIYSKSLEIAKCYGIKRSKNKYLHEKNEGFSEVVGLELKLNIQAKCSCDKLAGRTLGRVYNINKNLEE